MECISILRNLWQNTFRHTFIRDGTCLILFISPSYIITQLTTKLNIFSVNSWLANKVGFLIIILLLNIFLVFLVLFLLFRISILSVIVWRWRDSFGLYVRYFIVIVSSWWLLVWHVCWIPQATIVLKHLIAPVWHCCVALLLTCLNFCLGNETIHHWSTFN